jgi:integrase
VSGAFATLQPRTHRISNPESGPVSFRSWARVNFRKWAKISCQTEGVIKIVKGTTYDMAGNVLKRFGFHSFRHTLASFLLAQGNSPVLIKSLLRWSKISMLDTYGHVMTDEKIAAQGTMLERIMKTTVVQ